MAAAALTAAAASAQGVSIQFENGDFKVTGYIGTIADPEGAFAVYVGSGNIPPLLGAYSAGRGLLVFHPRFPLAPGVHYRAVFQLPGQSKVEQFFDGPPQDNTPTTVIEHIYPSAAVLPANQLKLYLYFSAPMSRGEAWQHISLLDESGAKVSLAFLELEQELWDPDNRRLTVLFDPGRIKRGLVPETQLGLPLLDGKKYKLVIDSQWRDAHGVALANGFEKAFTAGPADRVSPDPAEWKITAPKAGTSEPLVVDFPEPLDYALLQRLVNVTATGGEIEGDIAIGNGETQWRFVPHTAWSAGAYNIVVDSTLEDLAGNSLGRVFDVDLQQSRSLLSPQGSEAAATTVMLPFEVR